MIESLPSFTPMIVWMWLYPIMVIGNRKSIDDFFEPMDKVKSRNLMVGIYIIGIIFLFMATVVNNYLFK